MNGINWSKYLVHVVPHALLIISKCNLLRYEANKSEALPLINKN